MIQLYTVFPHINSHILCILRQRDHRHRSQHTPAWRYLGLKSLSTASLLFCLWHPLHTVWDQINQLLIPCQALKQKLPTAPAPDVVRVPLLTPQSTFKHFSEPLQPPPCVLIPVFNSPFDASPGPANFAFQINLTFPTVSVSSSAISFTQSSLTPHLQWSAFQATVRGQKHNCHHGLQSLSLLFRVYISTAAPTLLSLTLLFSRHWDLLGSS